MRSVVTSSERADQDRSDDQPARDSPALILPAAIVRVHRVAGHQQRRDEQEGLDLQSFGGDAKQRLLPRAEHPEEEDDPAPGGQLEARRGPWVAERSLRQGVSARPARGRVVSGLRLRRLSTASSA
jgi:hypothetical protein